MRWLESFVIGCLLSVLALGLALAPLELPWFTHALSQRYSQLPQASVLPLAEASRAFVIQGDPNAKATISAVMTPDAISHLDDVRKVIASANRLTLTLLLIVVLWMILRHRYRSLIARALRTGAVVVVAGLAVSVLIATLDFERFFAAFHGLFFSAGTWTFPANSVLIRLFPETFWSVAGGVWAALIGLVVLLYLVLAWIIDGPSGRRA